MKSFSNTDSVWRSFKAISGAFWMPGFALALALTDQIDRFATLRIEGPWNWLEAAKLVASERYAEAADAFAVTGGRPEEALARLLHARSRIDVGDRAGGEADLRRALDFWESVGAVACTKLAQALMAKSA